MQCPHEGGNGHAQDDNLSLRGMRERNRAADFVSKTPDQIKRLAKRRWISYAGYTAACAAGVRSPTYQKLMRIPEQGRELSVARQGA
jgi:hypothetical protein